jgi:hypothetical protein
MFERLDKDRFVRAYIKSQKLHATTYAADGKALSSSWDQQASGTPAKQNQLAHPSKHYGFDTPVLTARAARPPSVSETMEEDASDANVDKSEFEPESVKKSQKPSRPASKPKKERVQRSKKENIPADIENNKPKAASKKRSIRPESDDDDHAARESCCHEALMALIQYLSYILGLTERRERKRAKRAIVEPKKSVVSEDDDGSPLPKEKTSKTKKGKASKVPAGFALMHGFTATNVGKNRLTVSYDDCPPNLTNFSGRQLKPGPSTGVFGKGKASTKTQIVKIGSNKGTNIRSGMTSLSFSSIFTDCRSQTQRFLRVRFSQQNGQR